MGESREVELMEVIRSADVTSTGGIFLIDTTRGERLAEKTLL